MSAGPRLPLERADEAAACLMRWWGLEGTDAVVVGSVRRREPDVGDLEILAPAAHAAPLFGGDPLYERIVAGVGRDRATDSPEVIPLRGLKPGFAAASLIACLFDTRTGHTIQMPVQVFRCESGCWGWAMLMRTGPADFGRWFLWQWKRAHGIPPERPASVDGWLVDARGERVPTETEAVCFREINLPVCPPERRRAFAEQQAAAWKEHCDRHAHAD